jgi:beta-lactamase class A
MKNLFFFFILLKSTFLMAQNETHWQQTRSKVSIELQNTVNQLKGVAGVAVIDLIDGEKFFINADLVFAQGSAIKIPILMEVFKQASEGKFKLSDTKTVQKTDKAGGSGILQSLGDGTVQLSIRDLATLMVTVSDNTATNMLIDLVGMENVTKTINALGCTQTKLQRKMIQPQESAKGNENIATPNEAAKIMEIIYRNFFINKQVSEDILAMLKKRGEGASDLRAGLPTSVTVALKDGALNGVSTEWALVLMPERPFVMIFMENYELEDESQEAMKKLSKLFYDYFWRKGNASKYGTYVNPDLIKKN